MPPALAVAGPTLVMCKSADNVVIGTMTMPVQLLAAGQVGSPPPFAVALLSPLVALAPTLTFNVSVVLAPAASAAPEYVHDNAVVPVQFQPVPLVPVSVMPVGNVSLSAILALVESLPCLSR